MFSYQLIPTDTTQIVLPQSAGIFKCLILVERAVGDDFRDHVSEILVNGGCRYAMAWGLDCSLWDDSIDYANIAQFSGRSIPPDEFVMTTWHDGVPMEEALWFARFNAKLSYADKPVSHLHVLDFSEAARAKVIEEMFANLA